VRWALTSQHPKGAAGSSFKVNSRFHNKFNFVTLIKSNHSHSHIRISLACDRFMSFLTGYRSY
jgi:hypothetical protein